MSVPSPPPPRGAGSPPLSSQSYHSATITASNGPVGATTSSVSALDNLHSPNDAATKLAEAIDDFLGDLEKKFKGISDEILTKLDDMAERCDRLEQEMLLRDASAMENVGGGKAGSTAGSS
ncbi:uncharacterized protein Z519_01614 [Cladophialophora bantiana CBS 173.52]|uniref:Uncharacterized protein n=1 Tax=Cladophialophora bantiana (strain ATCC 10958 / CBS 173.52 / CDC B-1940 / NIH 8579) TaxID=1442370 RepID=A0A0D2I481_CLAB1|nr:uncharacterized protein Z519_01614 [Cladophialophora bantiana CBS 173.52]KIW98030.1 hypothetical protein Z519_01614 [Cladophialophora bantiana CBS 173.52]